MPRLIFPAVLVVTALGCKDDNNAIPDARTIARDGALADAPNATDAIADAAIDAAIDAPVDARPDAPADARPDAGIDAPADAPA